MWVADRIRRFGGRVRLLVVLKNTSNFAEETLFLLAGLPRFTVLRRLGLLIAQAENPGKHAAHSRALVAGVSRLGANNESGCVGLGTRWRREQVGDLIELDINYTRRLRKGFHVRVARNGRSLLHQFRPNGRGSLGATEVQVAVVVKSHPDDA